MSGSGRKFSSKWDSRDEPEFSPESVANSNNSRWSYMESNNKLKPRMGFSCKEHFSGGRGSSKDEEYKAFDATFAPDNGGSYDLKMSPRFEERKSKNHSHSSKDDYSRSGRSRSRSRSCSPPHGLQWNSGVNSRNRTRAGGLTKPCRDFAVGNCRRGSHCYFLHEDNHSYEDSRESRHRQDGAPSYSTPHESGDYSRASGRSNEACINFTKGRCRTGASGDDSCTERDIDRKSIENSFRQGGRHYANHNINTPCKFFAFGNCRNGKDCRFSHDSQAIRSPNRRLRDDRLRSSQDEEQALDRPKLSDSYSPNGRVRDRWGSDGSVAAEVDKDRDGPQQNDFVAVSDTTKLVEENKKGSMGAPEPGFIWPMSEGWDHSLDKNRVHNELPSPIDKKKANRWTADNAVDNSLVSQSVGKGIWPGDEKMSPDWNYGAKSSSHIKEEHGQNKQQVAPGQGLNQNAQNVTASHAAGQSQAAVSIAPPRARVIEGIQNHELSAENKYIVEPNIMNASLSQISSRNPLTPNGVSNEQLAQLSSLSASLAHILGTDRQLPQLHSTLNSADAKETPFISKTEGSGNPDSVTFIKPDPAIGLKQYDTMCNSMEPKNTNTSGVPSTFSPSTKIPKNAVEIPQLLSNPGQSFDDSYKTAISEELVKNEHFVQSQQGGGIKVKKDNNEMVAEEKPSSQTENKIKEDGPLENMDKSAGPVEEKKMKDVKVIRAFKNSLVEFIKELLKPTWKEGKINKEDFKAIVKKVTDKVTDTVEKKEIPQTQEKIDRYLSVSKPKLNKLVQAYVDKIQKP